jgi:hypothetical protein
MNPSPELTAHLFSYTTFLFAQPLFHKAYGFYKKKDVSKLSTLLWPISQDLESGISTLAFEQAWKAEQKLARAAGRRLV